MYYETAYQSLLGGISQQVPQARLPNQLSKQINMVSDPVRGLCRRAPLESIAKLLDITNPDYNPNTIKFLRLAISGVDYLLILNNVTGAPTDTLLKLVNAETGANIPITISPFAGAYIAQITDLTQCSIACVSDRAYLVTSEITPSTTTYAPSTLVGKAGYFYVATGAYNLEFAVTLINKTDNVSYSVAYQTPNGTGGTDPANSTPEAIADELLTALDAAAPADFLFYRDGPYVFIKSATKELDVVTNSNDLYVVASNNATTRVTASLPARLPIEGDGFVMRIGNDATALHYRYDATKKAWLEDADPTQRTYLSDVGIQFYLDSGNINCDIINIKTRAAGDELSNPVLAIAKGITGVFAFQGRLGLLADQYVCMSGVNDPELWFRSTVTQILDSDPIEIALTTAYSSPYRSAELFNDDLIIVADEHQVRVPGDVTITPRNATMGVVGDYSTISSVGATSLGQSLLLTTVNSNRYINVIEALPQGNQVNTLAATNITTHIPNYMAGQLRYIAASPSSELCVLGAYNIGQFNLIDTSQARRLYVHQYLWNGSEKVMASWHEWEFAYPVLYVYFIQSVMYICFTDADANLWLGTINTARGFKPKHYLDYARQSSTQVSTVDGKVAVVYNTYPVIDEIRCYQLEGTAPDFGEVPEPFTFGGNNYLQVTGSPFDRYVVGQLFKSEIEPTPPILRDRSENVLANQSIPIKMFRAHVVDTGELIARVNDLIYDSGEFDVPIINLYSPQYIGSTPQRASGQVFIPARTEARHTTLNLYTTDYYDFNITTLEFGVRLSLKYKRA
jgi:hypothetical protein